MYGRVWYSTATRTIAVLAVGGSSSSSCGCCHWPSRSVLLLMAEILHQLRLVVFPIIYRVSAPFQVVVWDFSHQQ